MRSISNALHIARNLLTQAQGWFMFLEVPRRAGGFYRLVDDNRHRSAFGLVWQAAGLRIELPEESGDGDLGQINISIGNESRLPLAAVEVDGELLGQTVSAWLAHESDLATRPDGLRFDHVVLRAQATEKVLTLACGHPASAIRVPSKRYARGAFPQLLPQAGVGGVRT